MAAVLPTQLQPGLTHAQKVELFRSGYTVSRGVVPSERINAALRLINRELGKGMTPEEAATAKTSTFCKNIVAAPEIVNLYNATSVISLVASALGPRGYRAAPAGQIALRYPGTLCIDTDDFIPVPWWDKIWHIDGFHSKENGIKKGEIRNFTCLVGVALSDAPVEFSGNLCVFPRSHHVLEVYFREHGFEKAIESGLEALPYLPISKPEQVLTRAGDVVICHYQLAHTIAPNASPNIRYMVYFRVNVRTGDKHHPEPMLDIWLDWEGMRDVVAAEKASWKPVDLSAVSTQSESAMRPMYADERGKTEAQAAAARDRERVQLQKQADEIFQLHQWKRGQPLFEKLAAELPRDFLVQIKTGCCFVFSPDEADVPRAEQYIRRAISIAPVLPYGYSLMAQYLARRKRFDEVLPVVVQMLTCARLEERTPDTIVDGLKCAREALANAPSVNNPEQQLKSLCDQGLELYPDLRPRITQEILQSNFEVEKLWQQGKAWLAAPHKDFAAGQRLFERLVQLKPDDFWATLLTGGCYTWGSFGSPAPMQGFRKGEEWIRRALALPNGKDVPNGFALLAQNLLLQGKKDEVVSVIKEMILERTFPSVATDPDHATKITEALTAAKTALGPRHPHYQALATAAKTKYPGLTRQIDNVK